MPFNAGYDFYVPTYQVELESETLPASALLSLTIDENLEDSARFTLVFNDRIDPIRQKYEWLEDPQLEPGKPVKIALGYFHQGRELPVLFTGKIKALAPSFPATGIPSLTVDCYDLSHDMKQKFHKVEEANESYEGIARQLAEKNQLESTGVEPTEHNPKQKIERNASQKDWFFLKDLAQEINYEFFVREKTLYFRKPQAKAAADSATKVFQFRRDFIGFTPRLSTAGQALEVKVFGWNPTTKEPIVATAGLKDVAKGLDIDTLTWIEKIIKATEGEGPREIEDMSMRSKQDAQEKAKVELSKMINQLIQGSLECIGEPDLRPGTNIKIEGLGKFFNGVYYITSAVHSLDDQGYRTNLEVRRNMV